MLVATVSAGALAVASYLLVRDARLNGSLAASAAAAREDLNLAAAITYQAAGDFVRAYEQRGTHAVLIFPGGRKVASNAQVNPPIPAVLQGLVRQGQLGYQRMDVAGQPYLVVAGQVPGSNAQLYLFFSEQGIQRNLAQLRNTLAAAWLGVLLVAALVGRVLARRTLEPVARASEAARLIAGGRLDTRLPVGAADEFGAWAAAFNEMADALEAKIAALSAAQARELRFTANVAHELRTPLTALVAEASLLGSQVSHLPDPARRPVELMVADVRRLRTLVDELMEISRLDAGSEPVLRRRVDVRSVVAALISARGWQDQVAVHRRAAHADHRSAPDRADTGEPGRQRGRAQRPGCHGADRHRRCSRPHRRGRRGSGHPAGAPAARLRALLQGRLGTGRRGQRSRPGYRARERQAPGRRYQRVQ